MNETLFSSLTADAPSAALKLSAAWDGLSPESQMEVLQAIRAHGRIPPDVATRSMASANAFVRYLAADVVEANRRLISLGDSGDPSGLRFDVDDELRPARNAALNDTDPLVRSAVAERLGGLMKTPRLSPQTREAFWKVSKAERFRYVRSCDGSGWGDAGDVAALIEHGLSHDVPEDEVTEALVEYVNALKGSRSWERYALLNFAERAPANYAAFIRRELDTPRPPNSIVAWVEPRVAPAGSEPVYFDLKDPVGIVARLSLDVCLWGTIIGLLIGVIELIRTGALDSLPFLIAIVLGTPLLLKSLLVQRVESSDHPRSGSATPTRLRWIRRTWRLSWLLIVVVGVGAAAALLTVFGPAVVDAYRTPDLRVLVSANILLLLFFMWRVSKMSEMLRPPPARPDAR